jgi:anti-sigma factor ChrR (cupin superfamily)
MNELFKRTQAGLEPLALQRMESCSVDADAAEWQECGADGFLLKALMEDPAAGLRTWLMKVEPGAFAETHAHAEVEQIYVLEGSFYDQRKTYQAGEYILRAPGAMHTAGSDTGAVVLLFYSPPPSP